MVDASLTPLGLHFRSISGSLAMLRDGGRFAANPAGGRPQLIASVRVAVKVGIDAEYA